MSEHYACQNYNSKCLWNDDFQFFTSNTMAIITSINEGMLLYGFIREIGFVCEENKLKRDAIFGDNGLVNRWKNELRALTIKVKNRAQGMVYYPI